ncbi:J domain-containing protein [soil metagenome]
MKLDSKYFDKIRVKPGEERLARGRVPPCEWPGCTKPGRHKAPKGRDQEGQFHNYCTEHVQLYNKTYNYFAGMKDDAVADYQKDARTGHRPTWKLGENSWATHNGGKKPRTGGFRHNAGFRDAFGVTGEDGEPKSDRRTGRLLRNGELKALHTLGLDETATPAAAKSQYKTLVKRLHPDANNGSRANEDTLKAVIQAYDHLRSTGFC